MIWPLRVFQCLIFYDSVNIDAFKQAKCARSSEMNIDFKQLSYMACEWVCLRKAISYSSSWGCRKDYQPWEIVQSYLKQGPDLQLVHLKYCLYFELLLMYLIWEFCFQPPARVSCIFLPDFSLIKCQWNEEERKQNSIWNASVLLKRSVSQSISFKAVQRQTTWVISISPQNL